jgi:hypothetical protein
MIHEPPSEVAKISVTAGKIGEPPVGASERYDEELRAMTSPVQADTQQQRAYE